MTHTVVVVEDEEDSREMMRSLLELAGFNVIVASDGRDALLAIASVEHVCLVLLDLLMPGMNGWDFFDAFRALPTHADTPVIVATSAPDQAPAGATLIMPKPLDPDQVIAAVQRYCAT